ncbi:MAG: hypothetical protein WC505_07725 [Patescibacteria group bacterium]
MQIKVVSRQRIEAGYVVTQQEDFPDKKFAVISIRDLGAREVWVITSPKNLFGVLRLAFEDDESGPLVISPAQAKQAADFIKSAAAAGVDFLVVHCEAGISRSAGVAAAAAEILGQPNDEFFRDPYFLNVTVYTSILEAAGRTPKRGAYDRIVAPYED